MVQEGAYSNSKNIKDYNNTPSKQCLNVRIAKGAVFMEHNQVIDEINYYKAQAITELLYARVDCQPKIVQFKFGQRYF